MDYFIKNDYIDLEKTLFCGQCFRFTAEKRGIYSGAVRVSGADGNAATRELKITAEQQSGGILLRGIGENDIPFWENYFDTATDYGGIIEILSGDATLKSACGFGRGIVILRQEPFETLISFIISQNNNIKRIGGIIQRLCDMYGGFPGSSELATAAAETLSDLRAGFRVRYIIDAAVKVSGGGVDFAGIPLMEYNAAKRELMKIVGVGDKVADCVLLYGFGKSGAMPKDVWIKRVLARYYPDGLPDCVRGYEGIAQQFLFHYIRNADVK